MPSRTEPPTMRFARPDHVRPSPTMLAGRHLPARQVRLGDDGPSVWLLTRYAEVRHVLGDRSFRIAPPPEAGTALTPLLMRSPGWPGAAEGADLALLRRLAAPAFTPRRTSLLREDIQHIVHRLLEAMASGERPTDLHTALTFPLPTRVICALLGLPRTEIDQLAAWSHAVTTPPFLLAEDEATTAWAGLSQYFAEHLAHKRSQPADDLLSHFAFPPEDVTDEMVIGLAIGLFIAGHETTVSQLEHGFLALFEHQDQLELLRRDPGLAAPAVEEILRMCPLNARKVCSATVRRTSVILLPDSLASARLRPGLTSPPQAFSVSPELRGDVVLSTGMHGGK